MLRGCSSFISRESSPGFWLKDCRLPTSVVEYRDCVEYCYINQEFEALGEDSVLLGFFYPGKTENLLHVRQTIVTKIQQRPANLALETFYFRKLFKPCYYTGNYRQYTINRGYAVSDF